MHENVRYVKFEYETTSGGIVPGVTRLALVVAVASALLAPGLLYTGLARAENVPDSGGASDAMLAVAVEGHHQRRERQLRTQMIALSQPTIVRLNMSITAAR